MPENIFKLYRPSKRGNKDKKGSGLWHNESEQERFNHIKIELSRYCDKVNNDYDYLDLVWHIKNAVVGDIFFSEKVSKMIEAGKCWNKYYKTGNEQDRIIQGIMNRKTLQPKNGEFDETFLEIRKWLGKDCSGVSLIFEHIIPAKKYIAELINAYMSNKFNEDFFKDFRKKICVCIITKEEDEILNKSGRKEDIPNISNWDFNHDKFARYDSLIEIHGKNIKPQKHDYTFREST